MGVAEDDAGDAIVSVTSGATREGGPGGLGERRGDARVEAQLRGNTWLLRSAVQRTSDRRREHSDEKKSNSQCSHRIRRG